MDDEVPGDMRREHRSLEALFGTTRETLETGDGGARIEAATHLREALETHFAQEDSLYYPTLLALRPEHEPALRACMDGHEEFRARLGRLVESARRGASADALRILDDLVETFDQHEAAEETVLAAIDPGEESPPSRAG